jgi:hypothetical protein
MTDAGRIERDRLRADLLRKGRVGERVADLFRRMPDVLSGSSPISGFEPEASRPVGDLWFPVSHSVGVADAKTDSPDTNPAFQAGNLALARTAEIVTPVN